MSDEYPDSEFEEDDDYDEWADDISVKGASIIGKLSGDIFGNQADYLWKCNECSGLFVAARSSSMSIVVGMIAFTEPEKVIEERISSLWAQYYEAVQEGNTCACPSRGKLFRWSDSPFRGAFRELSSEDFDESNSYKDEDESDSDPS